MVGVYVGIGSLLSAPDGEGDTLLERVVEVVGLPVFDVIGVLQLSIDIDIYVFEEAKIQLLTNDVFVVFLQVHEAAIVCFLQRPQEVVTNIICVVFRCADRDFLAIMCNSIAPIVFLSRLPRKDGVWSSSFD